MASIISLVVLMGIVYALLILPQQRRMRRHEQLVAGLEIGDEVLTSSGIYGTIVGIEADDPSILRVEIAKGVVVSFDRSAVNEVAVEVDGDEEEGGAEASPGKDGAAADERPGDST